MENKRQFPRVELSNWGRGYHDVFGAEVLKLEVAIDGKKKMIDVDRLNIIDLSYNSVAFKVSNGLIKKLKISMGDKLGCELKLSGKKRVFLEGNIVRITDEFLALKIDKLDLEKRMSLEEFLKDKMIGVNTYLISPKFYNAKNDFDFWFHGPANTNIVIWKNNKGLEQVFFEMTDIVLIVKEDRIFFVESGDGGGIGLGENTSAINQDELQGFKESSENSKYYYKKALEILSQIKEKDNDEASKLLRMLMERVKKW